MTNFEEIPILNNFYQTSSFFPMPTVLISTISDSGKINLGSYSLCFPYYIAEQDFYAMFLSARNSSNTARNIIKRKKCAINFIPDDKKYLKEAVRLGFPGETTEEKMKDCIFTLVEGLRKKEDPEGEYPLIVDEAVQVFECTWMDHLDNAQDDVVKDEYKPPFHKFNGIVSENGALFILKIEKILLKPKYKKVIVEGVKAGGFPSLPVDYGYRDNTHFWFERFQKPLSQPIPKGKGTNLQAVQYAAHRIDPDIEFTDEACEKLVKVPRIFLKTALRGCVDWAKEHDVKIITAEHMDQIRNKHAETK